MDSDEILRIKDVAADLCCSKAHVYRLIRGTVHGVSPLPAIRAGRRRLVRRSSLEKWKSDNETSARNDILLTSSEVDAAGRWEGNYHA